MKKELAMVGVEANDVIGQHVDREVGRELENIAVGKLRSDAAAISRLTASPILSGGNFRESSRII